MTFWEVNCGHFSKKIESLRPSFQKLEICPYKKRAWPKRVPPMDLGAELFFGECMITMQHSGEEIV